MQLKGIKNLNITLLFSSPLNHLLISQEEVIKLFTTGDSQKDLFNFAEAPNFKAVIFPNQRKDIVFESARVILSDKSETGVTDSTLPADIEALLSANLFGTSKMAAYGINYDYFVESENISDLISQKITDAVEVKSAGVNVTFEQNGIANILNITPIGQEKTYLVSFNSQFDVSVLPSKEELQKQILEQSLVLEAVLKSI
jgi:hypothetical protein